ncbi:MAG TPA: MBL fold metallo-hydrolase [Actinokineospora sp.]|nr:MBL fold metallo-hydrolase [Actinokineospora sp.]
MRIHQIGRDITVLSDPKEVPGIGFLPINAFVLHAAEPVVVDTGLSLPGRGFMDSLGEVVDPADVRWIWLTHPDRDHTGSLFDLLAAAPQARVITTFLGVGILSTATPLPMDRVYLLNPGQSIDVGDRRLHAFRPPLFDSPATVGFFDDRSRACFSSDCFGAPLPSMDLAGGDSAAAVAPTDLRGAQLLWASVDSPWVHEVDRSRYADTIAPLRAMEPSVVLSSHLPPATGQNTTLFDMLTAAPAADPFVGPDQRALDAVLATFEPVPSGA